MTVTVGLPAAGRARLDLIDLEGKRLATVHDGPLPAGLTRIAWNGRRSDGEGRIGSGMYILRLETPSGSVSRKILVMN